MSRQKNIFSFFLFTLLFFILTPQILKVNAQSAQSNCVITKVGNPPKDQPLPAGCQAGCSGGPAKGELSTQQYMNIYGHNQAEVEANLVSIDFQGKSVKVHKLVRGVFVKVNNEITQAHTGYQFKSLGTYAWRTKNCPGSCPGLSTHSFGITIDINPATNPYTTANTHDIPQVIADIFKRNGFAWGGDWKPTHDWMHFQFEGTPGLCM